MAADGKINVLFVMLQMEMGGSERLVHSLACALDRSRFTPSIAWFQGERILPEFLDLDIPLHHVPKAKRVDWRAMRTIGSLIRERNIHIVNAHHFMPMVYSFYGSKIKNRARLVYTEHSEWEIEKISWKWRAAGRRLLRRADAVIGVSKPVATRLQDTFDTHSAKTFSIVNGVNHEAFRGDGKPDALKKELGIAGSDRVIGTVANFKKIKNHLFLLRAFKEIVSRRKTVKLLLIGRGFDNDPDNTEPQILKFIEDNALAGKVILAGYRSDIPALLGVMDIFCLTSFKEGLPISLIEAMAAGIPAVGADAEGIRDTIVPGRSGFLVSPDDERGLTSALLRLLQDESLRRNMGGESVILARDRYSLEECAKRYQDLFISLMQ
jgi:glycosyltransferase involved in cell wall biosynthesis